MMIIMSMEATQDQIDSVVARIEANGFKAHLSQGEERTVIGVVGNNPIKTREQFMHLPGIDRIVPMGKALTFNRYWDGYDLLAEMIRHVYVE